VGVAADSRRGEAARRHAEGGLLEDRAGRADRAPLRRPRLPQSAGARRRDPGRGRL